MATEVYSWIRNAGGIIGGFWCSIYYETVDKSQNERIDIEMAAEIDRSLQAKAPYFPSERVTIRELTGSNTMACLLYPGDYDGLWDAYIALMTWIDNSGYHSEGPLRCIYLRLSTEEIKPLTELQIPIQQEPE